MFDPETNDSLTLARRHRQPFACHPVQRRSVWKLHRSDALSRNCQLRGQSQNMSRLVWQELTDDKDIHGFAHVILQYSETMLLVNVLTPTMYSGLT